jgi:hypothetical protein
MRAGVSVPCSEPAAVKPDFILPENRLRPNQTKTIDISPDACYFHGESRPARMGPIERVHFNLFGRVLIMWRYAYVGLALTVAWASGAQVLAEDSWCYSLPGRISFECDSMTHTCPTGSPRAGLVCAQDSDCGGDSIFCDDFDEYCHPGTPPPGVCDPAVQASYDSSLHNGTPWRSSSWNYNTNSKDGSEMTIEEIQGILATLPYGARCPQGQTIGTAGQTTVYLNDMIGNQMGFSSVNGSDDEPLILTFT